MSSIEESIFFISSQETSINNSKKSNMTSLISENLSEDEDNLFGFVKELAINNDLPLPNKEKDFCSLSKNNLFQSHKSEFEINKEKIDKNMLQKILNIVSKYNH